jgi:hypothetical protein
MLICRMQSGGRQLKADLGLQPAESFLSERCSQAWSNRALRPVRGRFN